MTVTSRSAVSDSLVAAASMSVLTFKYNGDDESKRGLQHVCSGDDVYDDELGLGILDKIDGSSALVEFGASGQPKRIETRPLCRVYAVNNRKAPAAPQKTGRLGSGMASISSFFGGSSSSPVPAVTPKPRASRGGAFKAAPGRGGSRDGSSRGGGRGGGRGQVGSSSTSTPGTANESTAAKRRAPIDETSQDETSQDAAEEGAAGEGGKRGEGEAGESSGRTAAGFDIGAEHAEIEQNDGETSQPSKKAKAGEVKLDEMSTTERAGYLHKKYEERKGVGRRPNSITTSLHHPQSHHLTPWMPLFGGRMRCTLPTARSTHGWPRTRSAAGTARTASRL